MIYELYLNGEKADVRQDLGVQLSFNIDDINKFGSRDTSFSKTIVLPGTANNNKLLGFVADMGSFNTFDAGAANIGANFNVAQTTKAELKGNGLLLIKGVFRLLRIQLAVSGSLISLRIGSSILAIWFRIAGTTGLVKLTR